MVKKKDHPAHFTDRITEFRFVTSYQTRDGFDYRIRLLSPINPFLRCRGGLLAIEVVI